MQKGCLMLPLWYITALGDDDAETMPRSFEPERHGRDRFSKTGEQ